MIFCDIGNTKFHFLINDENKEFFLDEQLPKFNEIIYYISVNEKATKKLKKHALKAIDISKLIKLDTKYQGLGSDRMMGCLYSDDAIIVDAGSAITVDIMSKAKHKGGFILPGIESFKKIYPKISKKLEFEFEKQVNLDKIPLQTKDAINYAILQSIIMPIKNVQKNKHIYFTGGDGEYLSKFFDNATFERNLIFESMKGLVNANNSLAKR